MIPETSAANRVELLRATHFPLVWELDAVLLDGLSAADTTLLLLDGTFWLFTSIVGRLGGGGQLHLYWSHDLHGDWHPHPANPIVRDPGSARPAGHLMPRGRDLIRPGQDCTELYGRAVVLNRVETLSRDSYRERAVARIEPDWMPGLSGTHTYNADTEYEYLDGYRTGQPVCADGGERFSSVAVAVIRMRPEPATNPVGRAGAGLSGAVRGRRRRRAGRGRGGGRVSRRPSWEAKAVRRWCWRASRRRAHRRSRCACTIATAWPRRCAGSGWSSGRRRRHGRWFPRPGRRCWRRSATRRCGCEAPMAVSRGRRRPRPRRPSSRATSCVTTSRSGASGRCFRSCTSCGASAESACSRRCAHAS